MAQRSNSICGKLQEELDNMTLHTDFNTSCITIVSTPIKIVGPKNMGKKLRVQKMFGRKNILVKKIKTPQKLGPIGSR